MAAYCAQLAIADHCGSPALGVKVFPTRMTKTEIRNQMLRRRCVVAAVEVERSSRAVCARLKVMKEVVQASCLAVYSAFAGEVDLTEFIAFCQEYGKGVLLPRFDADADEYRMVRLTDFSAQTTAGKFGIREPVGYLPPIAAELLESEGVAWIVPGVAFDEAGGRLGRGRGYYDRILRHVHGCCIGAAYDWQIVSQLPCNAKDVPMHIVVSEKRVLRMV